MQPSPKVLKIAVMKDGSITADGAPTSLEALDATLASLAAAKGVVWYYRESSAGEPPSSATKVIAAIIQHKLPVSLSSKPDYSDAVGADGMSHPRQ